MNSKKRTGFIWLVMVLKTIHLLFISLLFIFLVLNFVAPEFITVELEETPLAWNRGLTILLIGLPVVMLIEGFYIQKLVFLRKNLLRWTHTSFGFSLFWPIVVLTYDFVYRNIYISYISELFEPSLFLIVVIAIWVIFYKHLKNALVAGRISFS